MKQIKLVCLVGCLVLLVDCMSSPRKQYYQLHMERDIGKPAQSVSPKLAKTLMIDHVEVEDIYNDYRIVYRNSPYQLNYYSYHFWIKRPGKVIRDAIYDFYKQSGTFKKITLKFSEGNPDYILKSRVDVIEEYDLKSLWFAHLKMEVEIKEFKTGNTVIFYRIDKRSRLKKRSVEQFPAAISQVLKKEFKEITRQFLEKRVNPEPQGKASEQSPGKAPQV